MALALVQKGKGSAVVVYWGPMGSASAAPGLPAGCAAALGPQPIIVGASSQVTEATPDAGESWQQILGFARQKSGRPDAWLCCVMGFSAGCRDVRRARWAGAPAFGWVLCDGMHAAIKDPDRSKHLDYGRQLVTEARAGRALVVITHSSIPTEPAYLSTRAVAELVTGHELPPLPAGQRSLLREPPTWAGTPWRGHLAVLSVGNALDAASKMRAHNDQANVHLAPMLASDVRDLVELAAPPRPQAEPARAAGSLGERAVAISRRELAADIHEEPAGSHRSPRIDSYVRGALGTNWCAWAFCWAAEQALQPGEKLPHDYTGRVAQLVAGAGQRWHRLGDGYTPRVGDGAIFARNGQAPDEGGSGHVARVTAAPNAAGVYRTIGGNEVGGRWSEHDRSVDDSELRGWIEYPAPGTAPSGQDAGRVYVAGAGWLSLEDEYLPRVVAGELGGGAEVPIEALRAQAIAARTYLVYRLRHERDSGTPAKPIPANTSWQVVAARATPRSAQAVRDTRGALACYEGAPITAGYVAGAKWRALGVPDPAGDRFNTERWVTYNRGRRGKDAKPDGRFTATTANRGCMSQEGAIWLGRNGATAPAILRFFYAEDVQILGLDRPAAPAPAPGSTSTPSTAAAGGLLAVVGLGIGLALFGGAI